MTDQPPPARTPFNPEDYPFGTLTYRVNELVEAARREGQAERDALSTALAEAREEIARLASELARWKVCENCGAALSGPGICDQAISESEKGLKLMHEETLTRAEAAESRLREVQGELATAKAELLALALEVQSQPKQAVAVRDRGGPLDGE